MNVSQTSLPGVLLIEPKVFGDARGVFFESHSVERYAVAGITGPFVQDNVSVSSRGVLRGLHFQHPYSQGKLVQVLRGAAFDVAVDIRRGSPTFGQWVGQELSDANRLQMWIPAGFAHGFVGLSDETLFAYKCTDYYRPEAEHTLLWNDPAIGVRWPIDNVTVSPKDACGRPLASFDEKTLPTYGPE
jgi:dTDP-4-dehydrorhamnose 3,5-epimerase